MYYFIFLMQGILSNMLCLFQLISLSATTSFAQILCFAKGEDSSSSSGGGGSASSKTDSGRGNGPLPLGGSGLMEEMSALLARRQVTVSVLELCSHLRGRILVSVFSQCKDQTDICMLMWLFGEVESVWSIALFTQVQVSTFLLCKSLCSSMGYTLQKDKELQNHFGKRALSLRTF